MDICSTSTRTTTLFILFGFIFAFDAKGNESNFFASPDNAATMALLPGHLLEVAGQRYRRDLEISRVKVTTDVDSISAAGIFRSYDLPLSLGANFSKITFNDDFSDHGIGDVKRSMITFSPSLAWYRVKNWAIGLTYKIVQYQIDDEDIGKPYSLNHNRAFLSVMRSFPNATFGFSAKSSVKKEKTVSAKTDENSGGVSTKIKDFVYIPSQLSIFGTNQINPWMGTEYSLIYSAYRSHIKLDFLDRNISTEEKLSAQITAVFSPTDKMKLSLGVFYKGAGDRDPESGDGNVNATGIKIGTLAQIHDFWLFGLRFVHLNGRKKYPIEASDSKLVITKTTQSMEFYCTRFL